MIGIECPFCDGYLEAPKEAVGRRIQCGHCEKKFTLEAIQIVPLNNYQQQKPEPPREAQSAIDALKKKTAESIKASQKNSQVAVQKSLKKNSTQAVPPIPAANKKSSIIPIIAIGIISITAIAGTLIFRERLFPKHQTDVEKITEKQKVSDGHNGGKSKLQNTKKQSLSVASPTKESLRDDSWLENDNLQKQALTSASESQLNDEPFPIKNEFSRIDTREYHKTYPYPLLNWMPKDPPKSSSLPEVERLNTPPNPALEFGHHLGPLGIRVRPYVNDHQNRKYFRMMVPNCLRDTNGNLALQSAEVVSIAPGSPADGHLKKGDLIVTIENQPILAGNQHRPEWQYTSKNRRGIQPQVGELIDLAQGRGEIRMQVLRWQNQEVNHFQFNSTGDSGETIVKPMPVSPGDKLHLIIDDNGRNKDDHAAWVSPTLKGEKGTLDLSTIAPDSATTGWGTITRGKDLNGNPINEPCITVHGFSEITFTIPPGYSSFSTKLRDLNSSGDYIAKVKVTKGKPNVTTREKVLWKGHATNTKAGEQIFSIPVQQGRLKLYVDNYDGFDRDGGLWWNLTLHGTYGKKKLLELAWLSASCTNGSIKTYTNGKTTSIYKTDTSDVIITGSDSTIIYELPKGTEKITGNFCARSSGTVQPSISLVAPVLPLTGEHASHLKNIRFSIGKTGSFAKSSPRDCPKSELIAKRQAEFLIAQQNADGSWNRQGGYTGGYWDTSYCGLALLSMNDPKYDNAIKKAAYYCGYYSERNKWTVPRANILTFLCEYYFRTKDEKILAAIQNSYYQLKACVKTDFMAGHSVTGFGYGIAGQHIGSGNMAIAMALAAKTPINVNSEFIDNIIAHMGELAVNGTFPYGRGRRMERSEKRDYTSGNAMLAPAVLAAYLHGGHASFIQETKERYRASMGEGDNSHSGSTKAFIWSSIAMAAMDEELYFDHMRHFQYKLTLNDIWEGGMMFNSFPMDLQTPEKAYGLWIRTAGTILALQAHKHNLAITGKKEYLPPKYWTVKPTTEWEKYIHQYYFRNSSIVAHSMTTQHIHSTLKFNIKKSLDSMSKMDADEKMIAKTRNHMLKITPGLISKVASSKWKSSETKGHAAELLSGLDFLINISKEGNHQKISIETRLPFHNLNFGMNEEDKRTFFEKSPLLLNAEIRIKANNLSEEIIFKFDDLNKFNFDKGNRTITKQVKCSADGKKYEGKALIKFSLGQNEFKYIRPLYFNQPFKNARAGDPTNWRRTKIETYMAPRAIYQSLPVKIMKWNFDAMYPSESMIFAKAQGQRQTREPFAFAEGDRAIVDINSSNPICAFIMDLDFTRPGQGTMMSNKVSIQNTRGQFRGDPENLYDQKTESSITLEPKGNRTTLEFDFQSDKKVNGIRLIRKNSWGQIYIWAYIKERWVPILWDGFNHKEGYHPEFATVTARKWRIEFKGSRSQEIQELHFYYNASKNETKATPLQIRDKDTYPEGLL